MLDLIGSSLGINKSQSITNWFIDCLCKI